MEKEKDKEKEKEMEMESEDPRVSLIRFLVRYSDLYQTGRSCRITWKLDKWIQEGINPDEHDERPYSFIFDCCVLSTNIQNEIITKYYTPVRHNFHQIFPELDSLVVDPIHYLGIVNKMISEMEAGNAIFSDSLLLDLQQEGLLSPSMVTTIVALRSSLSKRPTFLEREMISKMSQACQRSFILDSLSKKLDAFVHSGSQIGLLVPNLSALVGASIAAKLIGAAGGLSQLSTLPISNILSLSAANCRKDHRYDTALEVIFAPLFVYLQLEEEEEQQLLPDSIMGCYVAQTDIIRSTPHHRLQINACHTLAEGINLAAAIDLNRTDPTGDKGWAMGAEIRMMIEKWKEEEPALLMKLRTEPAERPKNKKNLDISKDSSIKFKPNLNKEKHFDIRRSRRSSERLRVESVLASLKEWGLTTTTKSPTS